jgi:lycopene beta-cyclase
MSIRQATPGHAGHYWDIVIVGGGLGGLSLAVELSQPAFAHLKILVLEKRSYYERDRTWSYWARQPHRYTALERRRWRKWAVCLDGRRAEQRSLTDYCTIDADDFYNFARVQIEAASHVHLRMGVTVTDVIDAPAPKVRLVDGGELSAQWIMDARPPGTPHPEALCQRFAGWEIQTGTDCFDTEVVELMDFRRSSKGLHFFYVLPYGPRQALVESTWLSPFSQKHDYEAELHGYLGERFGVTTHRKVYQEQGCLNLQMPPAPLSGARIVPLGRTAGTLRPSTGFAFLETINDAVRISRAVAQASEDLSSISPYRRDAMDLQMDRVFFEGLSADWIRAPEHFMALFEGLDAETLVSFLSGKPAFKQRLKVAMQLPKLHFLKAAGRHAIREVS